MGQRDGDRSVVEGVVGMPASTEPILLPADASSAQGRRAGHPFLRGGGGGPVPKEGWMRAGVHTSESQRQICRRRII